MGQPRHRSIPAGAGSPVLPCRPPRYSGSIPAGAGKPCAGPDPPRSAGVHPRGCGEARRSHELPNRHRGPSPRVRGSRVVLLLVRRVGGSIPAGAGKPACTPSTPRISRVHPRGCGEAPVLPCRPPRIQGPSPRVRGSLPGRAVKRGGLRSIPAGAGKPPRLSPVTIGSRVHPRGCGEASARIDALQAHTGPSPRVRGSRGQPAGEGQGQRSIPAGAGKPSGCAIAASFSCWRSRESERF